MLSNLSRFSLINHALDVDSLGPLWSTLCRHVQTYPDLLTVSYSRPSWEIFGQSQPGLPAEPLVLPVCLSSRSQLWLTALLGVVFPTHSKSSETPLAAKLGVLTAWTPSSASHELGKKWKQSQEDCHRAYSFLPSPVSHEQSLRTWSAAPLVNSQSPYMAVFDELVQFCRWFGGEKCSGK